MTLAIPIRIEFIAPGARVMSRLFAIVAAIVLVLSPIAAAAHVTGRQCPDLCPMGPFAMSSNGERATGSDPSCCHHGKACAAICAASPLAAAPVSASTSVVWIGGKAAKLEPSAARSLKSVVGDIEIRPPKRIT